MKTLFKKLLLLAAVIYIPMQSMAWGTNGHRICGQIADSYINAKTRKAIQAILGDESIAITSNWADFIKSDPAYSYLYNWHFINLEKAYTYPELQAYLKADTITDAYTKVNFLTAELKKKTTTKANKLLYLRMLIHIVEDLHQPLHTGHLSDKGGNDVKVQWFGKESNLHSVWDSQLIDFQQLSYTEYATMINHTTLAQRTKLQAAPLSEWIFESDQIADKLYNDVKPGENLSYKYNFKYIGLVNDQMVKAGVRLAGLLNQIFG
ncbi:S1/P1 nuclease [Mucilaginibacter sp. CAU 1740]|uniref:S1/P1 nuclease n=1 Tax=Mucilaginibacter sp. CAU 1740 TaxID=3140365 RepID=UPI00325C0CA3